MKHTFSAINGAAFLASATDQSYVDCPFNFVLGPGKSIGFWVKNNGSSVQVAFRNEAATGIIYFSTAQVSVKTSTGAVYNFSTLEAGTTGLGFFIVSISASNQLKLFVNGVENVLATLASGEVLDFSTGLLIGKGGGGIDNLACAIDDVTLWNREINENQAKVLYNRKTGITPNRVPFALPATTGLKHYLSFDNMGVIKDQVADVITGTICTLKGAAFEYLNQKALFFHTLDDYAEALPADWDVSVFAAQTRLAITYIFRNDFVRGSAYTLDYDAIMSWGTTSENDSFVIYYGNLSSSNTYMGGFIDQNTSGGFKLHLWNPSGGQPTEYPAMGYTVQTHLLTDTGYYLIHNGALVSSNTGSGMMPLVSHASYATGGFRLGKVGWGSQYDHFGMLREVSIMNKSDMTVDDCIALHKAYLGLAPGDSVAGADLSVLETTTYDMITDGGNGSNLLAYWKGPKIDGWGDPSFTGTRLKDFSGNNRHLRLVNYNFPTDPTVTRRGDKIIS